MATIEKTITKASEESEQLDVDQIIKTEIVEPIEDILHATYKDMGLYGDAKRGRALFLARTVFKKVLAQLRDQAPDADLNDKERDVLLEFPDAVTAITEVISPTNISRILVKVRSTDTLNLRSILLKQAVKYFGLSGR